MAARSAPLAVAALAVVLAVSLSGCLTVFPAKSLLTTDPRGSSLVFATVLAYENVQDPEGVCPTAGSDSRPVYVPEKSERVTLLVQAHLTSVPPELDPIDTRHFDLTIADGSGLVWVDVHLRNNDTQREVVVEGPRPGAWTVLLSWELCDNSFFNIHDQFLVQVVVKQPA